MADDIQPPAEAVPAPATESMTRREAAQMQFPSLGDHPEVEVAQRSADVTSKATNTHTKVFRVDHGTYPFDENAIDHEANIGATRQYMIDHGLRPVGDVKYTGSTKYDERTQDLKYEVEALPAAIAVSPETANVTVQQV